MLSSHLLVRSEVPRPDTLRILSQLGAAAPFDRAISENNRHFNCVVLGVLIFELPLESLADLDLVLAVRLRY